MASYYKQLGKDSLYRQQLDTILLNEDVESNTKMEIMRQLILQSEQTTKDSTQIVSLFKEILDRPQQNADLAMLCAQYMITKHMAKRVYTCTESGSVARSGKQACTLTVAQLCYS